MTSSGKPRSNLIPADGALDAISRSTLDNLLEGCQVIGPDWRYLYVNDAVAAHGRTTKEELLGRTMMEAYPGIEHTEMFALLRQCMVERSAFEMENQFTFPDGSRGWFELRLRPVPEGACILSVDITQRKRAEDHAAHVTAVLRGIRNVNQLITRERNPALLLRRACELMVESRGFFGCCVLIRDESGRWTLTSAGEAVSFERLCTDLGDIELPDCAHDALDQPDAIIRTEPSTTCRSCPVAASCIDDMDAMAIRLAINGDEHGVMIVAVPRGMANDEERDLLAEVAGDIAYALNNLRIEQERQQAISALGESERRLRTLLANLPGMAYRCRNDPSWPMEFVSEGCLDLTGHPADALVAGSRIDYGDLIHPDDQQMVWDEVQAALESDREFLLEYRIRDAAGKTRWVWEKGQAVPGQAADAAEVEGFIMDVSAQHEAQERLKLAQRLESVGRLAGGVAHDFNNMLSVVTAFSELIAMDRPDDEPLLSDLDEIRNAAKRAEALTRQLLAFSRRQILTPVVLDLNRVVGEIKSLLHPLLGEDIDLQVRLGEDLDKVRADRAQIEQIVMNLAVNARDAMPGGGKLTIETQNVELGQEYIEHHGTVTPGPYVMLAISDTGEGMNTDTRLRIFEPFFTTKKLGKGTGLGLATVYGIVKQSEGYIWVYSEPGQGTTFKVYLPRTEGAHTTTDQLPALREAGPRGGGEVLLVVEDEEAILRALERLLTRQGYTVLTAKDPQHAIEQVERFGEPIDLLLTDVVLPGGAGREIADTLRAAHPAMVVLYMSGYTDNSIVHHGVLDEGTPFLQKPFTPATALKKIRALLRGVEHETDEGEVE